MAEIDKGLPNVRQQIKVPSKDEMTEVATQLQESMPSPEDTEIRENEDGSVDINLEPGVVAPEQGDNHYANLEDLLPDSVLDHLGY